MNCTASATVAHTCGTLQRVHFFSLYRLGGLPEKMLAIRQSYEPAGNIATISNIAKQAIGGSCVVTSHRTSTYHERYTPTGMKKTRNRLLLLLRRVL